MSYKNFIFKHRNGKKLNNNSNFYENDIIYLSSIGKSKRTKKEKLPCITYFIKGQKRFYFFGDTFMEINKNKLYLIFHNQKYKINQEINFENDVNLKLKIKLLILDDLIILSEMFHSCPSLESISYFSNLNTSKITDISYMFFGCSSLKEVSDI